jgi:uncharacterized protein YajQ (UPF0234 family)
MPSFDIVCELNWGEVDNALNQAQKELAQRYDFRNTDAAVERTEAGLVVRANSEDRVRAALTVFEEKLVRRKVSLLYLAPGDPAPGPKNSWKIDIEVKEGIEREKAKELILLIKDSKLKVQVSIQEEMLRVTGKKKDDLQAAIAFLRGSDLGIEVQYKNFRD